MPQEQILLEYHNLQKELFCKRHGIEFLSCIYQLSTI